MRQSIRMDSVTPVSVRLKEARIAAGLSTRAVAEALKKRFSGLQLSFGTIANFESGKTTPNIDAIGALAMVYDRPINWFLVTAPSLTGIRYRVLSSKTGIKDRHRFESQSQHWLEGYIRLEERLNEPLRPQLKVEISNNTSPEDAATRVRKALKLKPEDSPIQSVNEVLELFGIRTMEMPTTLSIDGFAARLGNEHVIVLNPSSANDRCRLNAAHELGHVIFGDCDSNKPTTREMDDRAFEFACHLLIPRSQLVNAFEGHSAVQLVQYKERFGISMAAMIYRAEKLGVLTEKMTKMLWIRFSRRGWRANEPGRVRADRAFRFERMLDRAITGKRLTWSEAVAVTGINSEELQRRRDLAMGIHDEAEGGQIFKIQR